MSKETKIIALPRLQEKRQNIKMLQILTNQYIKSERLKKEANLKISKEQ